MVILRIKLRRLWSRKISNRMLLTYVGIGALPLIIVSVILISLTRNTVQSYIYERNMETARRASNEIFLFVKEPLSILKTTALSRDIVEMDPFAQGTLINKMKDEISIFRKIFVVSDSGKVTATTRFGEEKSFVGGAPFFLRARNGEEFLSDVYFSESGYPLLTIAEPIRQYDQFVGVLAGEIDLKNIWNLVDSITIGNTGFAFLLSADGRVISHREKEKIRQKEDYSGYQFFQDLREHRSGVATYNLDGTENLLVYVPIPKLNWGIVVQQSQHEAFTLARQMQARVLIFTAATILIALLLGILSVQRISGPILELVKGVREYAHGNLAHNIELKSKDELGELAQEFNSMSSSLQKNQKKLQRMERLAALSRFASLVSHEIRNPLNSMNINMQILKRIINRPEIDSQRKVKYLEVISSEITRMNDLVNNFLTIARPPELTMIRTDLHQVLEEVLLVQEARATSEGIEIRRCFTPETITGMFDYNQLKQVFHNIVVNAFEAMKDGGVLEVGTTVVEQNRAESLSVPFLRIEFKDSGEGIPREIMKEVFEFYYTTKRAGTGLGLAIAKQIIEAHKGRISLESEPGAGSSVFIELPIDEPSR